MSVAGAVLLPGSPPGTFRIATAAEADDLLDSPFVLIGTVDEMAGQILHSRERYGFTHFTVHAPYRETFGEVIGRVRALAG